MVPYLSFTFGNGEHHIARIGTLSCDWQYIESESAAVLAQPMVL